MKNRKIFGAVLIALLSTNLLTALEKEDSIDADNPLFIPRLNGQVKLDGLSNEPAWDRINPLPVLVHTPNFGNKPSEQTEILVGYDNDSLYIAGRLYDSEPSKIQSPSRRRDPVNPGNDWFAIILDTFNDKENALAFLTNPSGARWDAAITNDAEGQSPVNISWNTFWDVATVWNDQGWFAEIRIPFSSLRFQDRDGSVVMGLITWRKIAHRNERVIFPDIPPNWGFLSFFKPSKAQEIVFESLYSRKPLYIAPYILGGCGKSFELNEDETAYQSEKNYEHEAGIDIKYGLTSNLTLDVTLNTDFAQVEVDDQQVNLTRFSLFFPEKRLFFQERSSIFDFSFETSEPNRLFYSRRIGIHEDQLVRIYGGARLVGRIGPYDVGILSMQTSPAVGLPSENFGVLRLRRQVFNPYSYIGGIVTSRIGTDGSYNVAYGLDGIIRAFGDDYVTLKWAQTFETGKPNSPFSLKPARIRFNWQRRTIKGFSYGMSYARAGAGYNPGLGFEIRENYSRIATGLFYGWLPGETSTWFSHQISLNGFLFCRNDDGSVESAAIGTGWSFSSKSDYEGKISPKMYYENVPKAFLFSDDVEVPEGKYTFYGLSGEFRTPSSKLLFTEAKIDAGTFYDGWRLSAILSPRWNVSSFLELSGAYEFNHVRFNKRHQRFTAHIARVKALYMLNTKFSATAFIQYNSAVDTVITNIRIRYNPQEGIDLYLVYNESLNTNRYRETPLLPFSNGRAILLKYTYTFLKI